MILLDLRTHRDPWGKQQVAPRDGDGRPGDYAPNTDPAATILGDEQWAWLQERLGHRSGLAARALARPAAELVASLRAHVERRVARFLEEHPICELQGIGPWMSRLVEALPATSERDQPSNGIFQSEPLAIIIAAGARTAIRT